MELYANNRAHATDTGLALVPRLKYEHVHLTSYSKMRVDLAAQVRDYVTLYRYKLHIVFILVSVFEGLNLK